MKLSIFIFIIFTFAFVHSEYNLLAFGDIGQIDIFYKRNPGKLFITSTKAKLSDQIATNKVQELLKEESFSFKKNRCSMTVKGKKIDQKKEGYNNFRKILCAAGKYIKRSDQITILGDLVYAENKGLKVLNNTLLNPTVQKAMEDRTKCGMLWFRELMSQYRKYCPKAKKSVYKKLWNSKAKRLHQRFFILEGNHATDVNYLKVSHGIARLSLAKANYIGSRSKKERHIRKDDLHLYPRFKSVRKGGLKIQYVDINTVILNLILDGVKGVIRTKEEYYENTRKVFNIAKVFPYREAVRYVKLTFRAISRFSNKAHWRIIRSHHPPMNIEGGFGEQLHFWTVKYNGKTLFQLMKEKRVKIFLASHHHSGHVMAFPYDKMDNLKDVTFDPKALKEVKGNCIYRDPKVFSGNLKNSAYQLTCPKKVLNFHLADNFDSSKSGYLWIFVSGNSGRELDGMEGSSKTRGALIWGRAIPNQYGAVNFRFSRNRFTATYIEANGQGKVEEAAHFHFKALKKGKKEYNAITEEISAKLRTNAQVIDKTIAQAPEKPAAKKLSKKTKRVKTKGKAKGKAKGKKTKKSKKSKKATTKKN